MKKLLIITLCVASALMCSCAFGNSPADEALNRHENVMEEIAINDELEAKIENELNSAEIPYRSVIVTGGADTPSVRICLPDGEIAMFGSWVYAINTKCALLKDVKNLDVSMEDGREQLALNYARSEDRYGILMDYRKGEGNWILLDTVDDLAARFPAMKTAINLADTDPEDKRIYDEVMEALNSDFSRSEDEILIELAPQYGMTHDELKQFITNMMLISHGLSPENTPEAAPFVIAEDAQSIYSALSDTGKEVSELSEETHDPFVVHHAMIGIGPKEYNTHVYMYSQDGCIVAVTIKCSNFSNSVTRSNFRKTAEVVMDAIGFYAEGNIPVHDEVQKINGANILHMETQSEYYQGELLIIANGTSDIDLPSLPYISPTATVQTPDREPQEDIIQPVESEKVEDAAPSISSGQSNAMREAKKYLDYTAFSHDGLIHQLEYSGYSKEEATYAADNCGADWDEQALRSAKDYLDYTEFSYKGLIKQLEHSKFTKAQATYGADNCGADWNEQAVKMAKSYLEYSSFSKDRLIEQLEYSGFTHEQAVYGANEAY